jgi:hypothetical protein
MPIRVITGQPGNGKTLLMMEELVAAASKAERPLAAAGIDGLAPGMAFDLKDPRQWNAVTIGVEGDCTCTAAGLDHHNQPLPHAHVIPDGSLIFVDEAWKWFGHLQDARGQANPPHVLQLAEHRHRGLDFVMTTQLPNQLYPFMRGLIAEHTHIVRRFGTQFCDLFTWAELNEDVKSKGMREVAQRRMWRYDEALFTKYKSATLHTIKRKLPWKVLAIPVFLFVAAAAAWFAFQQLRPGSRTDALAQEGTQSPSGDAAPTNGSAGPTTWTTVEQYVRAHTPRVPEMPWSAPLYDGAEVTVHPTLACMSSGHNGSRSCTCVTEQGTPYTIPRDRCKVLARFGMPYNPFKEQPRQERRQEREEPQERAQRAPARAAHTGSGQGGSEGQQARYGGFRDTAAETGP